MEGLCVGAILKEIIHEIPTPVKAVIAVGLVVAGVVISVMDHGYEVNFSFRPSQASN